MADPVTLADIYALFQTSQAEADRRFAEADRRASEADQRAAEADRRLAELNAAAERRAAEEARRAAESDRQLQELKRIAANTSRVDRYAYQRGLFVIRQTGDTVAIANDTTFQPAAW